MVWTAGGKVLWFSVFLPWESPAQPCLGGLEWLCILSAVHVQFHWPERVSALALALTLVLVVSRMRTGSGRGCVVSLRFQEAFICIPCGVFPLVVFSGVNEAHGLWLPYALFVWQCWWPWAWVLCHPRQQRLFRGSQTHANWGPQRRVCSVPWAMELSLGSTLCLPAQCVQNWKENPPHGWILFSLQSWGESQPKMFPGGRMTWSPPAKEVLL